MSRVCKTAATLVTPGWSSMVGRNLKAGILRPSIKIDLEFFPNNVEGLSSWAEFCKLNFCCCFNQITRTKNHYETVKRLEFEFKLERFCSIFCS